MQCPRCKEKLQWESDWVCDDINEDCCGNGMVTYYTCDKCRVKVELTTDCRFEEEDDE